MKAYKGFNKDMTCTPGGKAFQFEEGKTYEEPEAKLCKNGFHACENPLDCWDHYDILNGVFHEVELDDVSDEREKNSTKVCAKKITIGARLDIKGIVKASVDFVTSSVKECFDKKLMGKKVVSEEDWAQIGSSGYGAKIGSSGYGAQIGSSGYGAQIGSSGDWAQIGSSGDGAQIGSSGDGAKIGSSGYGAKIGSSGDGAKIGSSGDWAKIELTGKRSVGACVGAKGKIKAKAGCWIVLTEWKEVDGKMTPVCVRAAQVDGEVIKECTWYKLEDGEIVEVEE